VYVYGSIRCWRIQWLIAGPLWSGGSLPAISATAAPNKTQEQPEDYKSSYGSANNDHRGLTQFFFEESGFVAGRLAQCPVARHTRAIGSLPDLNEILMSFCGVVCDA
jgi:hypothetical protein